MRSLLAVPLLLLAACHSTPSAPQAAAAVTLHADGAPQDVLSRIRIDAATHGYAILEDAPDAVHVDYGVRSERVAVPTDAGLWGTRVQWRETEVHASVLYRVAPSQTGPGSVVTLVSHPTYYHPDYRVWLPGPFDSAPRRY